MRLAVRLGAVDEYELAAVAAHGLEAGGVANTSTPNYVYRWTEREVEKTIASFAPHVRHRIRFFREFELPEGLVAIDRGPRARLLRLAAPVVTGVTRVLPRQANLFAFAIEKPHQPQDLQPWMRMEGGNRRPDPEIVGQALPTIDVSLDRHRQDWDRLADTDALWAVLTAPGTKGGHWNVDEFFATGEAEIAHVLTVAETLGRPSGRERALDFGCGVGRLTRALAARFDAVVGVDVSTGMIEQAQRHNGMYPACEFRLNTDEDLRQFGSDSFDFVYSNIVLQHLRSVPEITGYLDELIRITRPDGLVGLRPGRTASRSRTRWRCGVACTRSCGRFGVSESWMLRRTLADADADDLDAARGRAAVPPATAGRALLAVETADDGVAPGRRYYASPA